MLNLVAAGKDISKAQKNDAHTGLQETCIPTYPSEEIMSIFGYVQIR